MARDLVRVIDTDEMLEVSPEGPLVEALLVAGDAGLDRAVYVDFVVGGEFTPVEIAAFLKWRDGRHNGDDVMFGQQSGHQAEHAVDLHAFFAGVAEEITDLIPDEFPIEDLDAAARGAQMGGQSLSQDGFASQAQACEPDGVLVGHGIM